MRPTRATTSTAVSLFTILAATVVAGASPEPPVRDCDIQPPEPTVLDAIALTVGGAWGDSCVPNRSQLRFNGPDIDFEVSADYPNPLCLDVVSKWSLTETICPTMLRPGAYLVRTVLLDDEGDMQGEPIDLCMFIVEPRPGDLDGDGMVGYMDLVAMLEAWGGNDYRADINDDGIVGFEDMIALLDAWGGEIAIDCNPDEG